MRQVYLIIGLVFTIIGAIFTGVGVGIGMNMDAIIANAHTSGNPYILPYFFCGFGLSFFAIGVIFLLMSYFRRRSIRQLKEEGNYIMAEVVEVYQNTFVTINRRHPYVARCEYRDPYNGEVHSYKSENLMEYPMYLEGRQIPVYVDSKNPRFYYVDTEWGQY